jgi:thiamine kinase-like enzyme
LRKNRHEIVVGFAQAMKPTLPAKLLNDLEPHTGLVSSIVTISGGITNRNYKLESEHGAFMLRIAGERTELLGIDRANEFSSSQIAHAVGVGTKPIAFLENHAAILSRFIPDALTLEPETATARLERIVPRLRAFHGAPNSPAKFSPFQTVRNYHTLALEHGVKFPKDLQNILEQMTRIETALQPHARDCPCHNDLLPANFLDDGKRIWIIDWEYAGNGNPFFDLGNLAVNLELNEMACELLLELYFGKSDSKLNAQLQLMKLASDLREAFWGFLQSGISTLEFDFIEYGNKHLERFRVNAARGEFENWLAVLE